MKTLSLKGFRVGAGFTQDYMAEQLGMSASTYSKKERDVAKFSADEVKKISEILEFDISDVNTVFLGGAVQQKEASRPADSFLPDCFKNETESTKTNTFAQICNRA